MLHVLDKWLRLKPDGNNNKKATLVFSQLTVHSDIRLQNSRQNVLLKPRRSAAPPLTMPLFPSPFQSQFQGTLLPTLESFIMPLQNKVIIYTKLHTVMKTLFPCIVQLIVIINTSEHNLP